MNGILIIDKEKGYTSRDIVNIVGKKLNTKKIGHTGTLDPIATGVLVLCIGNATKLVEVFTSNEKEYIAELTLGIETDTLDITGEVLKEESAIKTKEEIEKVLESFKGTYEQEVPIYSAVKVGGKKLYEYARNNEEVNLPKRNVEIKDICLIDCIKYKNNKTIFGFKTTVSKGTYIRSLVRDIALKLNTIGTMSNLRRTRNGNFDLASAYNLKDIENNNFELKNIDKNLFEYQKIIVDDETKNKIQNGCLLENIYGDSVILFIDSNDKILAIYKIYEKDIKFLKPWKMFKEENK